MNSLGFSMEKTYIISEDSEVLLLEDSPKRIAWFRERIPLDKLHVTDSVEEAIEWTKARKFDVFFLDHDLSEEHYAEDTASDTSGTAFAHWLAGCGFTGQNMIIHSWNFHGRRRMHAFLPEATKALFGTFDVSVK